MTAHPGRRAGRHREDGGLEFAAWNTHNASRSRLKRYLRAQRRVGVVATVLTEVWSCHDDLEDIARRLGLQLVAEQPGDRTARPVPEHGDTVVLLHPDFVVESVDWVVLTEPWTVADTGLVHRPRRLALVRGTFRGQRMELLGAHGPTDNRFNTTAVAEFKATVADIVATTRPETLAAAIGDFNVRLDEARAWAAAHDLHVSGQGPDLILANRPTTSTTGRKRGSDHHTVTHRTAA